MENIETIKTIWRIPKIMHCIWIWTLPPPMKWISSWQEKHPTWEYKLWGNKELEETNWINQKAINHYKKTKQWAGVADVMRYEILYKYGWAMHWADSLCLNCIDELFEDWRTAYAVDTSCRDWQAPKFANKNSVAPLYACIPNSRLAWKLIEMLMKTKNYKSPVTTTWNRLMKRLLDRYRCDLKIWPLHYFIPEHYDGRKYEWPDKVFAVHYWGTTRGTYEKGL